MDTWLLTSLVLVLCVVHVLTAANYDYEYDKTYDYSALQSKPGHPPAETDYRDSTYSDYYKIKCYQCTSKNNPGCASPFDKASASVCQTGDSCMIIKVHVQNDTTIHRVCHESTSMDNRPSCRDREEGPLHSEMCVCFRSFCNASSRTSCSASLMFVVALISIMGQGTF